MAIQANATGKCPCGVVVWSAPSRAGRPHYRETILCPACGRDCSRRDFPGYQFWAVRRAIYLGKKRRKLAWWQFSQAVARRWDRLSDWLNGLRTLEG